MLVGAPDRAIKGMQPQSVTHVIIVLFIILGNIAYFAARRRDGQA